MYGKTWWGQQWLNALTSIDFSNRLPRGRTYANKGAVKDIQIKGGAIDAKVQGSQPRPYKVSVSVSAFTPRQMDVLLSEIQSNPALLAQLLNRELPAELYEFARQQGMDLFPRSWKDFPMRCSCPDFAVPCKHLAAVIYMIAAEIDHNPFLVLQLHGLDLIQALKERNVTIQKGSAVQVLTPVALCLPEPPAETPLDESAWAQLDFSRLEPLKDKLLKLLAPNPIFYEKDFRETLKKAYGLFAKGAAKYEPGKLLIDTFTWDHRITLHLDQTLQPAHLSATDADGKAQPVDAPDHLVERLRNTLLTAELRTVEQASDSVRAIYWIQQFCLQLLENGAVIPQLLDLGSHDQFLIRWLPATNNPTVKTLFERLLAVTPANLVQVSIDRKAVSYQAPAEQLYSLCSVFLDDYIRLFTIPLGKPASPWGSRKHVLEYEWVEDLFFRRQPLSFEGRGMRELPAAIQLWLNNFYVSHKTLVPLIRVEEEDAGEPFTVDVLAEDRNQPLQPPIALRKILNEKQYEPVRFDFLQDLMLLATHFPQLQTVLKSNGSQKAVFDAEAFVSVLLETLPVMQLFGIRILLPKSLREWVKPQASARLKGKNKDQIGSFLNLDEMLSFDWQVAVGDALMDLQAFKKLVKGASGLVRIKDRYVLLQQEDLDKLYKRLENPPKLTGNDMLKAALAEEYQGARIGLSPEVLELLRNLTQPAAVPLPQGLTAQLRPYQQRGYEWMVKNTRLGFGSLIADDMGLGKTLQVISLLLKFKEEGQLAKKRGLVVVPTTLLTNWQKEIARFAPTLQATVYHGAKRKLELADCDILLTTYGLVRSDQEVLKKQPWYVLVIDEAQNIKNPHSDQTKAVKALKADVRIAMSGTPVENRLSEFWSVLDFANKGYLGNLPKFTDEFAKPIQLELNHDKLDTFRKITAPFMLRRLKTDKSIITDLPDKVENNRYCTLTKQQAALYEGVVGESLNAIAGQDGIERKGLVLKLMTALKQIGNHPYQYTRQGDTTPDLSGKAQQLLDLLGNIYESQEKVLIFTQYREMGDLLAGFIKAHTGREPLFLHGGTNRTHRDAMVERFQHDRQTNTFILSLKAGGTGLNLTAANHVVHYDLWWNPAVENQATDRAFRIGQTRNVMVYRLINQGTMEEKIDAMIRSKRELADLSVSTGETWLGDLSTDELKQLVLLEK
ncbi:DEAD/DEAH box helicase [Nibrella viscosa]|uniref:DEAD/DEAH box helicase n=2 Tax=Nibrella viscosa TaxID=1084524 RepID=A0ABP8K857_9BACT